MILPGEKMKPGEVPSEPGWYIRELADGSQDVIRVIATDDGLRILTAGSEMWEQIYDEVRTGSTFIARVYPDRIGEE